MNEGQNKKPLNPILAMIGFLLGICSMAFAIAGIVALAGGFDSTHSLTARLLLAILWFVLAWGTFVIVRIISSLGPIGNPSATPAEHQTAIDSGFSEPYNLKARWRKSLLGGLGNTAGFFGLCAGVSSIYWGFAIRARSATENTDMKEWVAWVAVTIIAYCGICLGAAMLARAGHKEALFVKLRNWLIAGGLAAIGFAIGRPLTAT